MSSVPPAAKANPHLFFLAGDIAGAPGLVAARCGHCGGHTIARPAVCAHCLSRDLETVAAGQAGEVAEVSIVHHPAGGFSAPYVIAIIRTAEGMTLCAPMVGDALAIRVGDAVRFTSFNREDGTIGFAYRRDEGEVPHAGG